MTTYVHGLVEVLATSGNACLLWLGCEVLHERCGGLGKVRRLWDRGIAGLARGPANAHRRGWLHANADIPSKVETTAVLPECRVVFMTVGVSELGLTKRSKKVKYSQLRFSECIAVSI